MTMPADKIIITLTCHGYSIECYADRVQFAGQTVELINDGRSIDKYGDDLFVELPVELASALHDLDLKLLDTVIAL